ncbi:MAG TPA: phospholipase D-like domain-containing protein, partial [Polyangiaceae bacterium]
MTTAEGIVPIQNPSEHLVQGNQVRLLRNGSAAFPEMLAAIAGAEQQVLLEMYWFASDRIGRKFAAALAAAAERGVEVRVIFDAVGSVGASDGMFEELERRGVQVIEFNPIAPWKRRFRLFRLTRRDHRKILIVDGRIGFTGGINIADYWLARDEGGAGWRDDMLRIDGPAVPGLCDCFGRA